jgi:GTP-binding protein
MTIPVVAIVGRPNVGKSTLVNRIIGRREAIVEERPGVTRDRILYTAEWRGRPFQVVDTGGLELDPEGELAMKVADAARAAASEADVVVFVVDVTDGITAEDRSVADVLRKLGPRTILLANKVDTAAREDDLADLYSLGMGDPVAVSALHSRGVGDFLDVLTEGFPEADEERSSEPSIAIVGRPNVGKSTLFNRIVGQERSIVHDEPGTTRDAVDTVVELDGRTYRFVDTAGMRRASKVDEPTEFFGSVRTVRALERSDVAVLVVDGTEGISRQDQRLAEQIAELGRSAIVVLNKVDAVDADDIEGRRADLRRRLPHVRWAPMLDISARTGRNVQKLLQAIDPILETRNVRIPTPLLNAVVDDLQARTPIPSTGRGQRIKYATQAEVAPPTIVLFGADRIPDTWLRYLERGLRRRFGFEGTPIRFVTRGKDRRSRASSRQKRSRAG